MNKSMALLLAAVILGAASAQTTPPATATPPSTPSVTLPGIVPASVTRAGSDALGTFLAAGGEVHLVNAAGDVIGTLNADGTVTLVAGAALADARAVQVVPAAGEGETMTYTLTRDLSKPGAIKFEVQGPNGKGQSLPLSAVVNRRGGVKDAAATQPAETADDRDEGAGEDGGSAKPEKTEHPGKGQGGKGK